jgi:Ca-activated chloride channel family protein
VKKLEECISNYQETLKRTPDDTDAKYNIEMIRREIKNLMRRQQDNKQQQNQQQNQDQKDQQKQDQQNKDQQQQEQKQDQQKQDQQQQNQQGEQGTPTPQPMAQMPTPSPTGGTGESQNQQQQQPTAEPTQMLSISEEMARNLLDNLPEQRQRARPKQRRASEKDW